MASAGGCCCNWPGPPPPTAPRTLTSRRVSSDAAIPGSTASFAVPAGVHRKNPRYAEVNRGRPDHVGQRHPDRGVRRAAGPTAAAHRNTGAGARLVADAPTPPTTRTPPVITETEPGVQHRDRPDETAARCSRPRDVLSSVVSSQIDLHAQFGGVVPIAGQAHVELAVPGGGRAPEGVAWATARSTRWPPPSAPASSARCSSGVSTAKAPAPRGDVPSWVWTTSGPPRRRPRGA